MKKTILITVIAIVLVLSVAGTCFALYKQEAANKTVNISAIATENCNLSIGTSESLNFSEISPADGHTTKIVDITLSSTNGQLANGAHGIFKVVKSGDLATYIDIAVNEIPSVGGNLGNAANDALTEAGLPIALSSTPKYYRITMSLSAAAIADFSLAAEKTGSLTVSWEVDEDSVFNYDSNAYYAVGSINGSTAWYPTKNSILLNDTPSGLNAAQKNAVTLHNGDSFKVVQGSSWFNTQASNSSVDGVQVDGDGENIQITKDGTYYIFVNGSGEIWVDTHE